jgi:hypothetical protein
MHLSKLKHTAIFLSLLVAVPTVACTPDDVVQVARENGISIPGPDAQRVADQVVLLTTPITPTAQVTVPTTPKQPVAVSKPLSPKELGFVMVIGKGWSIEQWNCVDFIVMHESSWSVTADNPTSSAYGIPQALPGSKMATHGREWRTSAWVQIAWMLDYMRARYGSPCGAWKHKRATGWY